MMDKKIMGGQSLAEGTDLYDQMKKAKHQEKLSNLSREIVEIMNKMCDFYLMEDEVKEAQDKIYQLLLERIK
jgi:uncharacterized protein YutD